MVPVGHEHLGTGACPLGAILLLATLELALLDEDSLLAVARLVVAALVAVPVDTAVLAAEDQIEVAITIPVGVMGVAALDLLAAFRQ